MKSSFLFFPFDLFGSPGTRKGADLLADAFAELIADNKRETTATRARAYHPHVRMKQLRLDTPDDYANWRADAHKAIRGVWNKGEFLAWISGNHLGSLPIYEEFQKKWPKGLIVQLDAHLDVYHLDDCTRELSHGNFMMHCEGKLPAVVNVGSRELLLPAEHIKQFYTDVVPAALVHLDPTRFVSQLRRQVDSHDAVFLDLDCDVFDCTAFPAVAEPVPLGIPLATYLHVLEAIGMEKLVGVAISEFEPARDRDDQCLRTLMWLLEYLLLHRYETRAIRDA